jgi:predicted ATPase
MDECPWFWSWDEKTRYFMGGEKITGERWNDCDYTDLSKAAVTSTNSPAFLGEQIMTRIKRGSRWWKFDFHTHTPHSTDTPWVPLIGTAEELTPAAWLQKFMEAGIDCVAVTDHNGGDWIDRLRSELESLSQRTEGDRPVWFQEEFRIFPGVELSVNSGLHFLAIFSPTETTAKINTLLALVGYAGQKGNPEIRTDKSAIEVAKIIQEQGGICIPAHVDEVNGILLRGANGALVEDHQTTLRLLQCGCFSALEVIAPHWVPPQLIIDAGLKVPYVVGTDCHSFRGVNPPGSRFTWVKMGSPSFEGLKLALIDGEPLSVKRNVAGIDEPNTEPDLIIESISISNLRLMGRANAATTGFSPWLTTIIGGRGTGKSTIIDCLRIGLNRVGDLADPLKAEFKEFDKIAGDRRSRGAMLESSTIVVHLRKAAARFRLAWNRNDQSILIDVLEADGTWRRTDGDIRQRFPVRVLSQKEIFEIAREPQSLINLVDSSPDFRLNDWRDKRNVLNAQYKRLVGQQRELIAKTANKNRLLGEYEDTQAAIAIFEQGDNRQTLQDFQIHRRQERALEQRAEEIDQFVSVIQRVREESLPSDIEENLFDSTQAEHVTALEFVRESRQKFIQATQSLSAIVTDLQSFNLEWRRRLSESGWQQHGIEIKSAFDVLIQELAGRGVTNAGAYAPLVQKRQQLDQQLKDIASAEKEIERLNGEIAATLNLIDQHRKELSARRETFLSSVLDDNQFVRVKVLAYGVTATQCEALFREALGRSEGLKSDILSEDGKSGMLAKLYENLPGEPAQRATVLSDRIDKLKTRLITAARNGGGEEFTQWCVNHLQKLSSDDLDKIRLWYPEDSLEVDYKRGNDWASIEQGSPGQQTAAILAFLMSHGSEPMILDQPEDDLDNHLIYDLIVRQIRQSKQRRQIIIATHNANIVVNGDAEMVIAMASKHGQCVINDVASGALQECAVRDEVCNVMEGGRDAFLKRYQRIVHPGSP